MTRPSREFIRKYEAFSIYRGNILSMKPYIYYLTNQVDLGRIMWHATKKQYRFHPSKLSVWSVEDLADIQEFMAGIQGEGA